MVVPTVNVNCEWDTCDPATHAMLRALPSWGAPSGTKGTPPGTSWGSPSGAKGSPPGVGLGRNHLIWDYNDAKNLKYRADEAFFVKTSMSIDEYRPGELVSLHMYISSSS